jgi:HK97 family phage major capsid protein
MSGGFLAGEEVASLIIPLREQYGAFRKTAQIVRMAEDTTFVPRRTSGLTASWTLENTAITESSAAFDAVGGVAKKLAVLVKVSNELLEDSAPDLASFVAEEAAFLFAQEEDTAAFAGTGISPHAGITGVVSRLQNEGTGGRSIATGHSTIATITNADLTAMIGLLPAFALPRAAWFANAYTIASCFFALGATSGGLMQRPDGTLSFLGFPIIPTQELVGSGATTGNMPVVFGDMSQAAILFERRELSIAASWQRFLEQDLTVFRITERIDIVVHALNSTSAAGPVVGLQLG